MNRPVRTRTPGGVGGGVGNGPAYPISEQGSERSLSRRGSFRDDIGGVWTFDQSTISSHQTNCPPMNPRRERGLGA